MSSENSVTVLISNYELGIFYLAIEKSCLIGNGDLLCGIHLVFNALKMNGRVKL